MRFIVTGCPRSGTRYAAALLQAAGVPCNHESAFGPKATLADALRWYDAADCGESSWLAWAFLGMFPGKIAVLHQLRDPWKVIDSLAHRNQIVRIDGHPTDHRKLQRDTIEGYCPRIKSYTSPIDRAAVMVLDWHERIKESAADHGMLYTYRVEQLTINTLRDLLSLIGITRSDNDLAVALSEVPIDCNQGRKITHNSSISNPDVARYISEAFPYYKMNVTRVEQATEKKSPERIAGEMNPRLLDEVNRYATRHGYPVVSQEAVA